MIDRAHLEAVLAGAAPEELLVLAAELQGRGIAALTEPKPRPGDDRLLNMAAVAEVLGVAEGQVRELGRRGELPLIHVGRYVRVRASTLREWMATRERGRLRDRRAG